MATRYEYLMDSLLFKTSASTRPTKSERRYIFLVHHNYGVIYIPCGLPSNNFIPYKEVDILQELLHCSIYVTSFRHNAPDPHIQICALVFHATQWSFLSSTWHCIQIANKETKTLCCLCGTRVGSCEGYSVVLERAYYNLRVKEQIWQRYDKY